MLAYIGIMDKKMRAGFKVLVPCGVPCERPGPGCVSD